MEANQPRVMNFPEFRSYLHSLPDFMVLVNTQDIDWELVTASFSNRLNGTDVDADQVIDSLRVLIEKLLVEQINTDTYRASEEVIGSLHPGILRILEIELYSRVHPEPAAV